MLEPDLRRLAWREALRHAAATADGRFFTIVLVQSLSLNREERDLIAAVLEHFGRGKLRAPKHWGPSKLQAAQRSYFKARLNFPDPDPDAGQPQQTPAPPPSSWRTAAERFARSGDLIPLARVLRSSEEIGPLEIELLYSLFGELRFKRRRGNQSRLMETQAQFQARIVERHAQELKSSKGIGVEKARLEAGEFFYGPDGAEKPRNAAKHFASDRPAQRDKKPRKGPAKRSKLLAQK